MKHKKKLQKLANKQKWWDSQSKAYQAATTRPGSLKKA